MNGPLLKEKLYPIRAWLKITVHVSRLLNGLNVAERTLPPIGSISGTSFLSKSVFAPFQQPPPNITFGTMCLVLYGQAATPMPKIRYRWWGRSGTVRVVRGREYQLEAIIDGLHRMEQMVAQLKFEVKLRIKEQDDSPNLWNPRPPPPNRWLPPINYPPHLPHTHIILHTPDIFHQHNTSACLRVWNISDDASVLV